MLVKLDHIGILVQDLDEAIKRYCDILNLDATEIQSITTENLNIKAAIVKIGQNFVELIQPLDPESREAKQLKEKGEGLYHLCFFSEDYDEEVRKIKEKGYDLKDRVDTNFPGYAMKQAWLFPEKIGSQPVIELVDINTVPPFLKNY